MSRLLLIEALDGPVDRRPGDTVVALTPEAVQGLIAAGQPYQVVSDFGSEQALANREPQHWQQQLTWLREVSEAIRSRWPGTPPQAFDPAIRFGYHLKAFLDGPLVRLVEAECTLSAIRPDEVVLFESGSFHPWPAPVFRGDSLPGTLNSAIWPLVCRAKGIRFQGHRGVASSPSPQRRTTRPRAWLRRVANTIDVARFAIVGQDRASPDHSAHTILFLHHGQHLRSIILSALKTRARCLLLEGRRIFDLRKAERSYALRPLQPAVDTDAWDRVVKSLLSPESDLWAWPNGWCDVPVSDVLSFGLRTWMRRLPYYASITHEFQEFFARRRVDLVVTAFMETYDQAAAVAAADAVPSTSSVIVNDGDGPDVAPAWDVRTLLPFHHFVVNDPESAEYFRSRRAGYSRPTAAVHVGSDRWRQYRSYRRRPFAYVERWDGGLPLKLRRPPGRVPTDRPIVVYPISDPDGDYRYLNKPNFNEAWYCRFVRDILAALATAPSYTVVVKLYPSANLRTHPIARCAADLSAPNVFVSKAPFAMWLPWAARVILDKPSTTLFQTAIARVPFHLLVNRALAMRASALAPFRERITEFTTSAEAAAAVAVYLAGPDGGSFGIDPPDGDTVDLLSELAGALHDRRRDNRVPGSMSAAQPVPTPDAH